MIVGRLVGMNVESIEIGKFGLAYIAVNMRYQQLFLGEFSKKLCHLGQDENLGVRHEGSVVARTLHENLVFGVVVGSDLDVVVRETQQLACVWPRVQAVLA